MKTEHITTLTELSRIASEILAVCVREHIHVITLAGDLGAGKTACTKAFATLLGIATEVTSPTFVIMKTYDIREHTTFTRLAHLDAYRIESEDEMRVIKLDELMHDPATLVCIEWPEKIQTLIPHDALSVSFILHTDGSREITYGIKN